MVHSANHADAQRIAAASAGSPVAVDLGSATYRDPVARRGNTGDRWDSMPLWMDL